MRRAVCPGSFDPVTNGHLDIFTRAAALYDEVVVAVGTNSSKNRLFTVDERLDMLCAVTADLPQIRVAAFSGLLVDFCRAGDIPVITGSSVTTPDVSSVHTPSPRSRPSRPAPHRATRFDADPVAPFRARPP